MDKKGLKFAPFVELGNAKCYLYHSTKIAKARPGHPVQINFSSP